MLIHLLILLVFFFQSVNAHTFLTRKMITFVEVCNVLSFAVCLSLCISHSHVFELFAGKCDHYSLVEQNMQLTIEIEEHKKKIGEAVEKGGTTLFLFWLTVNFLIRSFIAQ